MFKINKKKEEKSVSDNKVRIEVWRLLGGEVPYAIAKFEATQVRDSDNNLILVEANNNFKDDVDIVKNKLLTDLHERLELHKEDIPARIKVVEDKIKLQQSLLSSIKNGYIEVEGTKEKKKVNRIDEDCKLREYEALLDTLKNSGGGSYEMIDSDGLKRIFYLFKEGILIPYKVVRPKTTLYPDISTKRKLYKENQDLIDQDFFNDNKGFLSGWKRWVAIGILLIWLLGNIYFSVSVNKSALELETKREAQYGTQCAYWCSSVIEDTETFIKAYDNMKAEEEKSEQTDTIPIG